MKGGVGYGMRPLPFWPSVELPIGLETSEGCAKTDPGITYARCLSSLRRSSIMSLETCEGPRSQTLPTWDGGTCTSILAESGHHGLNTLLDLRNAPVHVRSCRIALLVRPDLRATPHSTHHSPFSSSNSSHLSTSLHNHIHIFQHYSQTLPSFSTRNIHIPKHQHIFFNIQHTSTHHILLHPLRASSEIRQLRT